MHCIMWSNHWPDNRNGIVRPVKMHSCKTQCVRTLDLKFRVAGFYLLAALGTSWLMMIVRQIDIFPAHSTGQSLRNSADLWWVSHRKSVWIPSQVDLIFYLRVLDLHIFNKIVVSLFQKGVFVSRLFPFSSKWVVNIVLVSVLKLRFHTRNNIWNNDRDLSHRKSPQPESC